VRRERGINNNNNNNNNKLLGIITDGGPSITDSKHGMVSLLYKHTHDLGLQNESVHKHCIIHQQNITGNTVGFKQIMTCRQSG
jgi:hypothetical protein